MSSAQESTSEWSFLQCFGERTPGEDIQEGQLSSDDQDFRVAAGAEGPISRVCPGLPLSGDVLAAGSIAVKRA